jgi:hypothetical protein
VRSNANPPLRPAIERTSFAFSNSAIKRRMTTGFVCTLSAIADEHTGPLVALRANTLNAWMATTKRLLDNILFNLSPL